MFKVDVNPDGCTTLCLSHPGVDASSMTQVKVDVNPYGLTTGIA
jgi:hypothetical protein